MTERTEYPQYDDYLKTPRYKVGDRVRIHTLRLDGLVMEVTKAATSRTRTRYTIYVPMDPEPLYCPVHESSLEPIL